MKKTLWKLVTAVFAMTSLMASTAFAAGWTLGQGDNQSRWWYDLGNGQYYGTPDQSVEWQNAMHLTARAGCMQAQ